MKPVDIDVLALFAQQPTIKFRATDVQEALVMYSQFTIRTALQRLIKLDTLSRKGTLYTYTGGRETTPTDDVLTALFYPRVIHRVGRLVHFDPS